MQSEYPKFDGLAVSSKLAICGLPIRLDTYTFCTFGCEYCFSNGRVSMAHEPVISIADVPKIRRKLDKIFNKGQYDKANLLDTLIAKRITWHCGGMSDPFQPVNEKCRITNEVVDVCNEYGVRILFSTKSDTIHGANCDPKLHAFQLSVTNVDDRKDIEPNVPPIASRKRLFDDLKAKGFKVGIRIQPFIPKVSDERIIDLFADADHFVIEGLKLVPNNGRQVKYICDLLNIPLGAFKNDGLFNLDYVIRKHLYDPIIERIKTKTKATYNVSDNDLRHMGECMCCCGDSLVGDGGASGIDTTAMIKKHGRNYGLAEAMDEVERFGIGGCKCCHLFASNRQDFGRTVEDFFRAKFHSPSAPVSPRFQANDAQMEMFAANEMMPWINQQKG